MLKHILLFLITKTYITKIEIISPLALKTRLKNNLKYSLSTFGDLLYSKKTEILLITPESDNTKLCKKIKLPEKTKGLKIIILAERGECTYSKKGFIAQQSGAHAVMVYHNDNKINVENIIPCSDSIYNNIKIPIILINKKDGEMIKQYIVKEKIILSMKLEIEGKESDFVNVDYWVNPTSLKSYDFLKNLKTINSIFGNYINFRPVYKFKNLKNQFRDDFLVDHCYQNGKFCGAEGNKFESFSILNEGLRQICIWELSKKVNNNKLWWDYVLNYKNCLYNKKQKNKENQSLDCYKDIYSRHSYNNLLTKKIEGCITKSFLDEKNKFLSKNKLLEKNANKKDYKKIYLVPAIFLNDNLLKEDLKENIVISGICDKLLKKPQACKKFLEILDWEGKNKKNFFFRTFFIVFFFFWNWCGFFRGFFMVFEKMGFGEYEERSEF